MTIENQDAYIDNFLTKAFNVLTDHSKGCYNRDCTWEYLSYHYNKCVQELCGDNGVESLREKRMSTRGLNGTD